MIDFCPYTNATQLRPTRKALPFHFGYEFRVLDIVALMATIHIHPGPHTLKYSFTCCTVSLVAFNK